MNTSAAHSSFTRSTSARAQAVGWLSKHNVCIVTLAGVALCAIHGAAKADALDTPAFTGPLAPNPDPTSVDGGPLGPVYLTAQLTAIGLVQSHAVPAPGTGNGGSLGDLSNAQVQLQTTEGLVQFYLQGGAYSLPSLGSTYLRAEKAPDELFGVLPIAYATLAPTPEISFQVGALPTLIGAEYTFTFQNMNIERGLLWNQEPAVSKGMQLNFTRGPITAAVSYNDGFYSDHYNWISGLLAYELNDSNAISIVGGGNFSSTAQSSFVAPLAQNNSSLYNIIYTYSSDKFTVSPYVQYTHVKEDTAIGIDRGAHTLGGAVLGSYNVTEEFAVAARAEYVKASGGGCGTDVDCEPTVLLYGPDSSAWSLTVTPSYQKGVFFARAEVSFVRISSLTAGFGFGDNLDHRDQVRGLIETGVLF